MLSQNILQGDAIMPYAIFSGGTNDTADSEYSIISRFWKAHLGLAEHLSLANQPAHKQPILRNLVSRSNKNVESYRIGHTLYLPGPRKYRDKAMVADNVQYGVLSIEEWLQTLAPNHKGKYVINLWGYSRGAVTNLRIVNRFYEKCLRENRHALLAKIECNLLGIDPVAGPLDKFDHDAQMIPPIVKNYIATLQIHERRVEYTPQDMGRIIASDPVKTNVMYLPMIGKHSDTNSILRIEMRDCPEIMHNIFYRIYRTFGMPPLGVSQVREYKMPFEEGGRYVPIHLQRSNSELLELFARAKKNRQYYIHSGKENLLTFFPKKDRTLKKHLALYTADADFFMNAYERNLFKAVYPNLFDYCFQHDFSDKNVYRVKKELKVMRKTTPELFSFFKENKIYKKIFLPDINEVEKKHDEKNNIPTPVLYQKSDAEKLRDQLWQVTASYRRHKSKSHFFDTLLAFTERFESHRCESIKRDLMFINSTARIKQNGREKREAVLERRLKKYHSVYMSKGFSNAIALEKAKKRVILIDVLECHYLELLQIGSVSELRHQFENILRANNRTYEVTSQHDGLKGVYFIGKCVEALGSAIRTVSVISSSLGGLPGKMLEGVGRFCLNTRGLLLPGIFFSLVGNVIKGISSIPEKIGYSIQKMGQALKGVVKIKAITLQKKVITPVVLRNAFPPMAESQQQEKPAVIKKINQDIHPRLQFIHTQKKVSQPHSRVEKSKLGALRV